MQRISQLNPGQATGSLATLFDAIKSKMGMIPNLLSTMAHSEVSLKSYLDLSDTLAAGTLAAADRERIAVAVAGLNQCQYCASAHCLLATHQGISQQDIADNLQLKSADAKTQSLLNFIQQMVNNRGKVSDQEMTAIQQAGYGQAQIIEIVAHIALNTFTNYFNNLVQTDIDFPLVELN